MHKGRGREGKKTREEHDDADARGARQGAHERGNHERTGANPLNRLSDAHEVGAKPERPVAVLILYRVSDLVGGHRDRGERAPLVLVCAQAHGFRRRVVMIALVGGLDGYVLHAKFVEQVARQLCTCSRVAVRRTAVALDHPAYPEAGSENQHEQHNDYDDKTHAVIVACLSGNE